MTNKPKQHLGQQAEPNQASGSSCGQEANQPAPADARTFLSSSNNLETLFSDESIQMTDGNPPQFVVCEKKDESDSQETQSSDVFQETEELPSQETDEASKQISGPQAMTGNIYSPSF